LRFEQQASFRSNATVLHTYLDNFAGNSTGHYRETILDDRGGVTDSYYYLLEGEVLMDVRIVGDISEVQVHLTGDNLWQEERDTISGYATSGMNGTVSDGCSFMDVDLELGGSYKSDGYLDYSDDDERMEQGCLITITPMGENIEVEVDHSEIHLAYVVDQTNVQATPHAEVTVTLTTGAVPMKNKFVVIKVCTLPGTLSTDGHIGHDARASGWEKEWNQACDQGQRPFAELISRNTGFSGNLIVDRTDSNGKIFLDYIPPKHGSYQFIAGTDQITATAVHSPTLQDKTTVITKVPDLLPMPGSSNCVGTTNYKFAAQSGSKHGCLFYGTAPSNLALQSIADQFMQRQQDCISNPDSVSCLVNYSGGINKITLKGSAVPMRINAMSLPWGGLTDNVGPVAWRPPHASHNDGRQVDLSFGIFQKAGVAKNNVLCNNLGPKCADYDIDRIMLLREVVESSPNFHRFPSVEGGNLAATFKDKAPHIHIFFKT
jgi:hypothetical protein